jgi:hypothetical protein
MYTLSQRPLTEAERERLTQRLRAVKEEHEGAWLKLLALAVLEPLFIFGLVMMLLGRDRSGPVGTVLGIGAMIVANLFLLPGIGTWRHTRRERRKLTEALADGMALTEAVEARTAAWLVEGIYSGWYLFDVGGGRTYFLPVDAACFVRSPEPTGFEPHLPACFEVVRTRCHRLHVGTTAQGHAALPLPTQVQLSDLFPGGALRQRLVERLDTGPLLACRLSRLEEDLRWLPEGEPEPLTLPNVAATPLTWGTIQGRLEERFRIALGPGELAAGLARLRSRPATAADLVALVWQRLPKGAVCSTKPATSAFFRLRDALVAEGTIPRHRARPSARLDALLPQRGRHDLWSRLTKRLGKPLPALTAGDPPLACVLVMMLGMGLVYLAGVPTVQAIDAWAVAHDFEGKLWYRLLGMAIVPSSFLGGMGLAGVVAMYLFRNRIPLEFPAACNTVAALARHLAANDDPVAKPWTGRTCWQMVRGVLAEATGKPPIDVRPNQRLVEDLGLPHPG